MALLIDHVPHLPSASVCIITYWICINFRFVHVYKFSSTFDIMKNFPQDTPQFTVGVIQNGWLSVVSLKIRHLNKLVTTFKITSVAAAVKFKTYHHPSLVQIVIVTCTYPAPWLIQAKDLANKISRMKNFMDDQWTITTLKYTYIFQKFVCKW